MVRQGRARTAIGLCVCAMSLFATAQTLTLQLQPEKSSVNFTLQATAHQVHGSFKLKQGVVHFDPATGQASGSIVVDAASGQTGNDSRDNKMQSKVLESVQYPEFVFTPTHVAGPVHEGKSVVQVEGTLNVHGQAHPMKLNLEVVRTGETVESSTEFEVPYVDWGMKNPSNFMLHVADKVQVEVKASGRLTAGQP